jgi:outer membrane autotransporter protein
VPGLGLLQLAASFIAELEGGGVLSPAEQALVDALYAAGTAGDVAGVIADFSPSGNRGSLAAAYAASQMFTDQLSLRLGLNGSTGGFGGGGADYVEPLAPGAAGYRRAWLQGLGGVSDVSDDGAVAGFDTDTWGLAAGGEIDNGAGLLIGAAFAVTRTNFDGDSASGDVTSFMPALYGKYRPSAQQGWYVSGILAGQWNEIDQSRFNSAVNETLTADYSGAQVMARAETGHDFYMNSATVTPFVAGTLGHINTDGYTEEGGLTALTVDDASDTYGLLEIGSRFGISSGQFAFDGIVGWREDFGTLETDVVASLPASTSFTSTYDLNVSGLFAGATVSYTTANDVEIRAGVLGTIGEDYSSIGGSVTVGKKF